MGEGTKSTKKQEFILQMYSISNHQVIELKISADLSGERYRQSVRVNISDKNSRASLIDFLMSLERIGLISPSHLARLLCGLAAAQGLSPNEEEQLHQEVMAKF